MNPSSTRQSIKSALISLDQRRIGIRPVPVEEFLQGAAIFREEIGIGGAGRKLVSGLLHRPAILIDHLPDPIGRQSAHDGKVLRESGNIFDNEPLALPRDLDRVGDRINAGGHRIELRHHILAIRRLERRAVGPDILVIQGRTGNLRMRDDACSKDPEGVEEQGIEDMCDEDIELTVDEERQDKKIPAPASAPPRQQMGQALQRSGSAAKTRRDAASGRRRWLTGGPLMTFHFGNDDIFIARSGTISTLYFREMREGLSGIIIKEELS